MAIKLHILGNTVKLKIQPAVIVYAGDAKKYDGAYIVTPKVDTATILPTNGKIMQDDVTVKVIPQYRVSNQSGGITLIIDDKYSQGG